MEKHFTVKDIVTRTGISNHIIRGLINAGKIPALKIGQKFFIKESDLNNFLNEKYGAFKNELSKSDF